MAFGVKHAGLSAIVSLGASSPIGLVAAAALSFMLHWPLDDLNVGTIARLYHNVEESRFKWFIYSFRVVCWLGLVAWIAFAVEEKLYPSICIVAGTILDLDHIIPGCKGRLHSRMWPNWLHSEWGLIPIVLAMALIFLVLLF